VDGACKLDIYDLGGGKNIRKIWERYYAEVHGAVFCVDAADKERLAEARTELHGMMRVRAASLLTSRGWCWGVSEHAQLVYGTRRHRGTFTCVPWALTHAHTHNARRSDGLVRICHSPTHLPHLLAVRFSGRESSKFEPGPPPLSLSLTHTGAGRARGREGGADLREQAGPAACGGRGGGGGGAGPRQHPQPALPGTDLASIPNLRYQLQTSPASPTCATRYGPRQHPQPALPGTDLASIPNLRYQVRSVRVGSFRPPPHARMHAVVAEAEV
jgi:hypothetical protein